MKSYSIIKMSTMWSTDGLRRNVETVINEKARQGYDIVSVAFGVNLWWKQPSAVACPQSECERAYTYPTSIMNKA